MATRRAAGASTGSEACTVVEGDTLVTVRLRIGVLSLIGRAERPEGSLRFSTARGTVLEATHDPIYAGEFNMTLTMPAVGDDELVTLAARHQSRLDAPPLRPCSSNGMRSSARGGCTSPSRATRPPTSRCGLRPTALDSDPCASRLTQTVRRLHHPHLSSQGHPMHPPSAMCRLACPCPCQTPRQPRV